MIIETTKQFDKQYAKLKPSAKLRFKTRIDIFINNPYHRNLRNHPLKGRYRRYRSIDITGDVRALYTERDNKIVIFGFIGTHSELYG